jgi:hypothetical protein
VVAVSPNIVAITVIRENILVIVHCLIIIWKHRSITKIQHFLYQIFTNVISSQLYIVFIQLDNFVQSQKWKNFSQK